jgi:hypothetical protein
MPARNCLTELLLSTAFLAQYYHDRLVLALNSNDKKESTEVQNNDVLFSEVRQVVPVRVGNASGLCHGTASLAVKFHWRNVRAYFSLVRSSSDGWNHLWALRSTRVTACVRLRAADAFTTRLEFQSCFCAHASV